MTLESLGGCFLSPLECLSYFFRRDFPEMCIYFPALVVVVEVSGLLDPRVIGEYVISNVVLGRTRSIVFLQNEALAPDEADQPRRSTVRDFDMTAFHSLPSKVSSQPPFSRAVGSQWSTPPVPWRLWPS